MKSADGYSLRRICRPQEEQECNSEVHLGRWSERKQRRLESSEMGNPGPELHRSRWKASQAAGILRTFWQRVTPA